MFFDLQGSQEQRTQWLRIAGAGDQAFIDQLRDMNCLNFTAAHVHGIVQSMKADIPSCPVDIGALRP